MKYFSIQAYRLKLDLDLTKGLALNHSLNNQAQMSNEGSMNTQHNTKQIIKLEWKSLEMHQVTTRMYSHLLLQYLHFTDFCEVSKRCLFGSNAHDLGRFHNKLSLFSCNHVWIFGPHDVKHSCEKLECSNHLHC